MLDKQRKNHVMNLQRKKYWGQIRLLLCTFKELTYT